MSAPASTVPVQRHNAAVTEAPWLRRVLIAVALAFLASFLLLPLLLVFSEALRNGVTAYFAALRDLKRCRRCD